MSESGSLTIFVGNMEDKVSSLSNKPLDELIKWKNERIELLVKQYPMSWISWHIAYGGQVSPNAEKVAQFCEEVSAELDGREACDEADYYAELNAGYSQDRI